MLKAALLCSVVCTAFVGGCTSLPTQGERAQVVIPPSLHEQLQPLVGKKCDMRHHEGHWILVFNSKDTEAKGQFGGTGTSFDWSIVPRLNRPVILAGGLTADNVCEAITQVRPFAVDVSGGVEKGKGQKDSNKIAAFIQAVNRADMELA